MGEFIGKGAAYTIVNEGIPIRSLTGLKDPASIGPPAAQVTINGFFRDQVRDLKTGESGLSNSPSNGRKVAP